MELHKIFVPIFSVLAILACSSLPMVANGGEDPLSIEQKEVSQSAVEGAVSLIGKKQLLVDGRKYNYDCTGVVLAAYATAGIDLSRLFANYTGNGVSRLYYALKDLNLLYETPTPRAGDLIFWDNTYDKNKDGILNDPLTHIGIVVEVNKKGQIYFVHHHVELGIVKEEMNLYQPDVHFITEEGQKIILNSPMLMRGLNKDKGWLSGQLYKTFGMAYFLEKEKYKL